MQRLIALILVLIPVILAVLGIKLIRDMTFAILQPPIPNLWLQFLVGAIFLIGGLYLIGSFIFHRDKKRNKLQKRFIEKK
jgi:polyferredoxin